MSLPPSRPLLLCVMLVLFGCAQWPAAPTASDPSAPQGRATAEAPVVGVLEMMARPAEQSLLAGLRAYDDGQYPLAERRLQAALKAGLAAPKDRAAAYKTLAFVYCSSKRAKACEEAFRAAREADPGFALTKAEAGHPLWGPVYRRTVTP